MEAAPSSRSARAFSEHFERARPAMTTEPAWISSTPPFSHAVPERIILPVSRKRTARNTPTLTYRGAEQRKHRYGPRAA